MFFPSPSKSPQKNKNKYHQRLSKPNSFNLEGNKLKRDRNYSNIETSHRYENKNYIDEWIENYEEKEKYKESYTSKKIEKRKLEREEIFTPLTGWT